MAAKRKFKRVVAIADLHCGHRVGLTPPQWQLNPENEWDAKWLQLQREQWAWYKRTIERLRPIHLLLVMGDAVDGASKKAEGRDSIRMKRREQVDMAFTCINVAKASHIAMVYGTRYHVADWEENVRDLLGDKASIGAHDWPQVNGVVFDIKHKVGGSQAAEYTRLTAIMREQQWNSVWAEAGRQPVGDYVLRAHVHYHRAGKRMIGEREVWAMTCPALQGVGTEFGAEQCSGTVDFGLLSFDVTADGIVRQQAHIKVLPSQMAEVTEY